MRSRGCVCAVCSVCQITWRAVERVKEKLFSITSSCSSITFLRAMAMRFLVSGTRGRFRAPCVPRTSKKSAKRKQGVLYVISRSTVQNMHLARAGFEPKRKNRRHLVFSNNRRGDWISNEMLNCCRPLLPPVFAICIINHHVETFCDIFAPPRDARSRAKQQPSYRR